MKKTKAEKIRIKTAKKLEKRRKIAIRNAITEINKRIRNGSRLGQYRAMYWNTDDNEDEPTIADAVVKYYKKRAFK